MRKLYTFLLILVGLGLNAQTEELIPLEYVPGTIYALSADETTGKIMVGGSFNESAGFPFAKFAIMEDDVFVNPGTGLPEDGSEGIMTFAKSKGILYSGSASDDPTWRLAKKEPANGNWEGTISIDGPVYALDTLSNGNLLVLGDFTTPYAGAFIYDGENALPLNGFEVIGTPTGVTKFGSKYFINYISAPQDYKNIFIWDETCECESADETNLPTNFIVYAVEKSEEEKLYLSLWNFEGGDKEFYQSSDGINFEVIGELDGTVIGIKSHGELIYFYGDLFEVNGEEVNPIVTYDPNTSAWESVGGTTWAGTGVARAVDFMDDKLYAAIGSWVFVYEYETPVDTTEDTVNISVFDIEKNINIYPNPTANYVTLEFDNVFSQNVTIYNSLGEIMSLIEISRSEEKIVFDVSSLPAGIYSVKSEEFTGRFLKL